MGRRWTRDALILGSVIGGICFAQLFGAMAYSNHWHNKANHELDVWEKLPDDQKTTDTLTPMRARSDCDVQYAHRFWFELPPYPDCTPTP